MPPIKGPWEHNGARFQHVLRDVDASPSLDLRGTLLDLYRISFAPIGNTVTSDIYEDVSVHAGHSPLRPITISDGVGALEPNYGLGEFFDYDSYFEQQVNGEVQCVDLLSAEAPNTYAEGLTTTVEAGTRWTLTPAQLFVPDGTELLYHPFPEFSQRFQYNNGDIPPEHVQQREEVNELAGPRYLERKTNPDRQLQQCRR